MKKNILKVLSILTILLSLIFISSCNNGNSFDPVKESYKDEFGFLRPTTGLCSESLVLNSENYNNYKDNLIGDSGESGFLNKEIVNLNEDDLALGKYYLIYVFFYQGNVKINFNTYLRFSLVTSEDILYDEDAVTFDDIYYRNYKLKRITSKDVFISFSKSKTSSEKLKITYDITDFYTEDKDFKFNYLYFSLAIPFNVDKYGKLDIDFKVNDSKIPYDHKKDFSLSFEENIGSGLAKVENYKVSYISEYLCEGGNIDDSLLSSEANFIKNYKKLMVVDFDIKALAANNDEIIKLLLYTPKDSIIKSTVEDAPTTEREETTLENGKIIRLSLKIPREKDGVKHCRVVYGFVPLLGENNIEISLVINGNVISVNDYKKESLMINLLDSVLKYNSFGTITGVLDKTITEINIPATYDGKEVSIGEEAFKDCEKLTYVNIENGVKSIGKKAFENCFSLKKIIFPNSLEEVHFSSFDGCPDSLLDKSENCSFIGNKDNKRYILLRTIDEDITSINIDPNTIIIAGGAFSNCTKLKKVNTTNVKCIGRAAFAYCFDLEEVILHNNLHSIGKSAFIYTSLKKIEIPSSVESIGEQAFGVCTKLTSIKIQEGLKNIEDRAFDGCVALTSIKIPKSVQNIGLAIFESCRSLESIIIPFIGEKRYKQDDLYQYPLGYLFGTGSFASPTTQYFKGQEYSGNGTFKTGVITQEYDIEESLKEVIITDCDYIQYGAFSNCSNLTSVKFLGNITSIEGYAFKGCSSLKEISIPDCITSVDPTAFDGCQIEKLQCALSMLYHVNTSKIKELYITSGDTIEDYRFRYWFTLEKVVIGDGISAIGDHAFDNCTQLKNVAISKNVTSIGNSAFYNCPVQILEIPIIYNLETIGIRNSVLREVYLNKGTEIPANAFRDSTYLEKVVVLDEITSIGQYAFSGCSSLKEVNILNSVTNIGAGAFANCAITSLILPDTLETIGSSAFFKCPIEVACIPGMAINYIEKTSLKEIKITSGTSISNAAFSSCLYLTKVELPLGLETIGHSAFEECKALKNVNIPNTVTSIGKSAFMYCTNLERINLPEGLTTIEESLFYSCSSLLSITIPSTVTSIGNEAFYRCEKMVEVYNLSNVRISKGGLDNGYAGAYAKVIHSNLGEASIIKIDDNGFVFAYFDNNYYLISYKGKETELTLPKNFNYYINDKAIGTNYNLVKVIIGKNVLGLLSAVFVDCINLKDIYYEGTEQEWYDITIAIGSDYSYLNITYNYSA